MPAPVYHEQEILKQIYEAPFDASGWTRALGSVEASLGATSAFLFSAHSASDSVITHVHNHSADMAGGFLEHWVAEDAWAEGSRKAGIVAGTTVTGSQLIPTSELVRRPFYGDFLRYHGMEKMVGCMLFSGAEASMPFTHVCWYRPPGAADFGEDERRRLRRLVPHFQRGMRLQRRLSWLTHGAQKVALDAIYVASFVLDRQGTIRRCNAAAEALLRDPRACRLRMRRLVGLGAKCSPLLADALRACTPTNPVSIATYFAGQRQVFPCTLFSLDATPPEEHAAEGRQHYMLLVEMPRSDGRRVAQSVAPLFGLTPAETRVLGELLLGRAPAAIADVAGTSLATVRTQMSNIFAKTGVSSQSDLLLLLRAMRF